MRPNGRGTLQTAWHRLEGVIIEARQTLRSYFAPTVKAQVTPCYGSILLSMSWLSPWSSLLA